MLHVHGAGAPTIREVNFMTTRSKGPLAGFDWLKRGISVGYRHPKPLLGGAALLVLACLLPSLITLPLQYFTLREGAQPSFASFGGITAISMLLSLLVVPLYAGYLQVIDAAEQGLPARARDIFKPYRQGDALRLIGYGLAVILLYVAMFGLIIAVAGGGIANWYMQAMAAQIGHRPPPGLPDGFGLMIALFMLLGLWMTGFYAISLGQVALRRRNVVGAIGDGIAGALKNLLPLLVFAVSSLLAWLVVAIVLVLAVLLLALIGKLLSPWLVIVLLVPIYVAMMLAMFAMMFGVMYYLWRDVCGGDDPVAGLAPSIAA